MNMKPYRLLWSKNLQEEWVGNLKNLCLCIFIWHWVLGVKYYFPDFVSFIDSLAESAQGRDSSDDLQKWRPFIHNSLRRQISGKDILDKEIDNMLSLNVYENKKWVIVCGV